VDKHYLFFIHPYVDHAIFGQVKVSVELFAGHQLAVGGYKFMVRKVLFAFGIKGHGKPREKRKK